MNQFNNMRMYGDSHDVQLNPDMTDNVLINISQISDGWKEQTEVRINPLLSINFFYHTFQLSVSRTAVEQYNGEGKPPHCEIIVEAAAKDVTPSDLSFTVSFNGLQKPLEISIGGHFEAQNIVECIAQVFYYRFNNTSINWWRAKIAFFPKEVQVSFLCKQVKLICTIIIMLYAYKIDSVTLLLLLFTCMIINILI